MGILEHLNTKFIGRNLLFYKELPSTQDFAHELIRQNICNGTVIFTANQTKGRGTNDRSWYSSANKNLTFSIVLYPHINMQHFQDFTIQIAEILIQTIHRLYQINLQIKYPNDIMLNNKKIGGILVETKTLGDIVETLVIGIGLNINETEIPEYLKDIATSLTLEFKKEFQIIEVLTTFLNQFEKFYIKIEEDGK